MIITDNIFNDMFNSVAREFKGRVELLEGSTLLQVFKHDDALQGFTIEKAGDNTKFFGYGICQKATVKLRDKNRAIHIQKGQVLQIAHGVEEDYLYTYPALFVDEVVRDEITNDLTITAYDAIYKATNIRVKDLLLPQPHTLRTFIHAAAAMVGMPASFKNINSNLLNLEYSDYSTVYANFSGEETLREALDDAAEVLGAIYYVNSNWEICFRGLDVVGEPVLEIDKSKYFELSMKTAHTIQKVMSVTELGDNIEATTGIDGDTAYLRENAFLTLRPDVASILDSILLAVRGLTLVQFECKHRGDFRIETGDKVCITTKDNALVNVYVLEDSITYNGGLVGTTKWEYTENEAADAANPTTLGDKLNQTFAKVDKAEKKITLLASETDELNSKMSKLEMDTDSITATVESTKTDVEELSNRVDATITEDAVNILVQQQIREGVQSVETATGFTFNGDGLTVSKSGTEMETAITEDGMTVYRNGDEMLVADGEGVSAKNLTASTYIILDNATRLSVVNGRVCCYWIGG